MIARVSLLGLLIVAAGQASPQSGVEIGFQHRHARTAPERDTLLAEFQGPRHGPSEADKERFRVGLGLTKPQQDAIETLFKESDQQMQELRNRYRDLTRKLNEIYDLFDYDRNEARQIRKEIMGLHYKMGRIHDNNEEQLRKILSRDQFNKMKAMIRADMEQHRKEFEQRRKGGGPPGPGPGPGFGPM